MFAVNLALEPLTYSQAKQLGAGVLNHCFTDKKQIRPEMTEVTIALEQPEQCLTVRMAEDVEEHCRLRQVRIRKLKIAKRDAPADGTAKSKKVSPQQPTLRATLECLVDSAEKVHQQFLAGFFGKTLYFSFDPEQEDLFTGVYGDEDDEEGGDDAPAQGALGMAPALDPAAGDVLDEQPAKPKGRKPRLAKGNRPAAGEGTIQ